MAVTDAILQPYIDAPTLLDAEQELDRLAGLRDELPVRLGDLYDDLAEAAANDDAYALAARLEAKALEAGCREQLVARCPCRGRRRTYGSVPRLCTGSARTYGQVSR